jgi:hypothetical protein
VAEFVDPMCAATAQLLRQQHNLDAGDYLLISVEDYAYESHDGQTTTVATKRFVCNFKNRTHPYASIPMRGKWWESIPGAARHNYGYGFTAPPTDFTALVILAALGKDRIEFEDEAARLEFWTHCMRFAKQTRVARAQAGYKQYKTIPNDAPRGLAGMPPMPHQAVASWCAMRSEAYALFMEQSTGKTYTTIMTIESRHKSGTCQWAFIMAPKNVCSNWCVELSRFSKLRHCVVRMRGGKIERTKALLDAYRLKTSGEFDVVYIVASFQTTVNSEAQVLAFEYDWGVIDEGHFIKAHRAQRTRFSMKLRDRCKRRLLLTGTPIANQLFDLYTELEFLGRGWSGFTSFDAFRKFYGSWEPQGRGVERLTGLQNVPLLQERLARCSFLIRKAEAMPDLPPKTYDVITCEMTKEMREVYDSLAEELYAEIERDIAESEAGKKTITAQNILTRLLRLAQITSGFIALDRGIDPETDTLLPQQIERFDPNPKLEELVTFIKGVDPLSKIIVWACFVQDIRQIAARLRLEGIECVTYYGATSEEERDQAVLSFNTNPKCKVFIGNPAAGGVGINLTGTCKETWPMRCDTIVEYSQNFSSVTRAQGEERPRGYLHESVSPSGKRETWSIRIVDICIEDSIDLQIRQRVTDKRLCAARIQDVRDLLRTLVTRAPQGEEG